MASANELHACNTHKHTYPHTHTQTHLPTPSCGERSSLAAAVRGPAAPGNLKERTRHSACGCGPLCGVHSRRRATHATPRRRGTGQRREGKGGRGPRGEEEQNGDEGGGSPLTESRQPRVSDARSLFRQQDGKLSSHYDRWGKAKAYQNQVMRRTLRHGLCLVELCRPARRRARVRANAPPRPLIPESSFAVGHEKDSVDPARTERRRHRARRSCTATQTGTRIATPSMRVLASGGTSTADCDHASTMFLNHAHQDGLRRRFLDQGLGNWRNGGRVKPNW